MQMCISLHVFVFPALFRSLLPFLFVSPTSLLVLFWLVLFYFNIIISFNVCLFPNEREGKKV